MYRVTGCIELELPEEKALQAVARALDVEARNPPDPRRGRVEVRVEPGKLVVCFEARDLAAARTLANTYLSLAATTVEVVAATGG
ncbi:KEOPS complex subunit Pcc1 [Hyperthermus butylicus]|uniref:KEOPS complex subunit Pcc1 n=1 Tax=Hyperthermus butylicus TaxID=54248 RepID=UPI000326D458|nr:KEOPS complex subunit Pcc1 [Hyperthermus butylicus]